MANGYYNTQPFTAPVKPKGRGIRHAAAAVCIVVPAACVTAGLMVADFIFGLGIVSKEARDSSPLTVIAVMLIIIALMAALSFYGLSRVVESNERMVQMMILNRAEPDTGKIVPAPPAPLPVPAPEPAPPAPEPVTVTFACPCCGYHLVSDYRSLSGSKTTICEFCGHPINNRTILSQPA